MTVHRDRLQGFSSLQVELLQGSVGVGQGVGARENKEGQEGGEEARRLSVHCAGEKARFDRAFFVAAGAMKPSAYAARALRRSTRPEVGSWLEMMNTPCAT